MSANRPSYPLMPARHRSSPGEPPRRLEDRSLPSSALLAARHPSAHLLSAAAGLQHRAQRRLPPRLEPGAPGAALNRSIAGARRWARLLLSRAAAATSAAESAAHIAAVRQGTRTAGRVSVVAADVIVAEGADAARGMRDSSRRWLAAKDTGHCQEGEDHGHKKSDADELHGCLLSKTY